MDLFGEEPAIAEEEALAKGVEFEPDEPEEIFKHPRYMGFCLGHDRMERELVNLFNSGRMPHALIFSGSKGIGKATMAYRLARFLLNQRAVDPNQDALFGGEDIPVEKAEYLDIAPDNPIFTRVASGGHPDLLTIEREHDPDKGVYKASVNVKSIREVTPFLRMTASGGGWRVVLIDDADTMNRNAQNALLKILEEPPANTVLILVTHRAGALIPTIRSRSRVMNFAPLSDDVMGQLIQKQNLGIAGEELKTLEFLSEGSFGRALQHVQDGGLETLGKIVRVFEESYKYNWPDFDWAQIHTLADDLSRKGHETKYQAFDNLTQWTLSKLLFAKARAQELPAGPLQSDVFREILKVSSLNGLAKTHEALNAHFDSVTRANLDKRQGVLGAFSLIKLAA